MDLVLSLVLSSAPLAPTDSLPAPATTVLDLEFAQAALMAEHRLAMPILVRTDSPGFNVIPVSGQPR